MRKTCSYTCLHSIKIEPHLHIYICNIAFLCKSLFSEEVNTHVEETFRLYISCNFNGRRDSYTSNLREYKIETGSIPNFSSFLLPNCCDTLCSLLSNRRIQNIHRGFHCTQAISSGAVS